jgi:hypothetical protein
VGREILIGEPFLGQPVLPPRRVGWIASMALARSIGGSRQMTARVACVGIAALDLIYDRLSASPAPRACHGGNDLLDDRLRFAPFDAQRNAVMAELVDALA